VAKKKKKKKVDYTDAFQSNGNAYKRMFKKVPGKTKVFEFKISKKETLKIKMKFDKKKQSVTVLSPFPKSKGGRYFVCHDCVSMYRILWDFVRQAVATKEITKKRKVNVEKILQKHYKLESKFIELMYQLDFVKKKATKKDAKLSKRKTNKKGKANKKSSRK